MIIERIETFRRDAAFAIVKVTCDDGSIGWGQTSTYLADYSTQFLHDHLARFFLGRDPADNGAIQDEAVRARYKHGGLLLFRALCGIDTAILDLLGKQQGRPVFRVLGGQRRVDIPVYGSSMRRDIGPEDEAERFLALRQELGFRAFKLRIGSPMGRDRDARPGRTEAMISTVRERLGPDTDLMVDANGGFTAARAIQVGRMLEDFGYFHFEEPCPYEEIEQTAQVTAALDIRVAGGEQDTSLNQFQRLISGRVVDVVQPDIGYLGGVTRTMHVARMAESWGMLCTPHCANRTLLQVFTAHVAAAAPSIAAYQEWSIEHSTWEDDIYAGVPVVEDGVIRLSEEPGWGIEIDAGLLRRTEHRESRIGAGEHA